MPRYFIPMIYTGIFALIIVAAVPKADIRRLSIYGIIFGACFDILVLIVGKFTGVFAYINYGPFGFWNIHFFAPFAWSLFFILYFYFLPKNNIYMVIYVAAAYIFSIFFDHMIVSLGIFERSNQLATLIAFPIWFSTATWGFNRLNSYFAGQQQKKYRSMRFKLSHQPARKIETTRLRRHYS